MDNHLPVDQLENHVLYRIDGRTAHYGVWNKDKRFFHVACYTCGAHMLDIEKHWDDDLRYGTAKPIRRIEVCPVEDEDVMLRYLLENEGVENPKIHGTRAAAGTK